jgi:hypothetical protein
MRSMKQGGTCAVCGRASAEGAFWTNRLVVLDFGVPTMPPFEPDTSEPERCDECEQACRMRRDFEANPGLARRVYGPDLGPIGE